MPAPKMHRTPPPARQRGAALIVALVILVIVTLLGISSMTTTQIESRGAATAAADNKLRQATGSLSYRLLTQPPSGVSAIHLLTDGADFEVSDADWQNVDSARTDDRNWARPDDCGSARWRVRQLHPRFDAPGNTEAYSYYELEVECYLRDNAVLASGQLASANVGPLSRVVSGMRIINQ